LSDQAAHCKVREVASGAVLADRLRPAHTHWSRLRGLLGTSALEPGDGLWLMPCSQVHMIGMRYPVDVAFLDDELRVVRTVSALQPGKISPKVGDATSVIELPSGRLSALGIGSGARLVIEPEVRRKLHSGSGLTAALSNLVLAVVYGFFLSTNFAYGWRTGQWATVGPIVTQQSVLIVLFLVRRRSSAVSPHAMEWLTGIVGTFLPFLLRPTEVPGLTALGLPLQVLGLLLALPAVLSLGRSVGLVPAHRGIKTAGSYEFVRHPMYTAHIMTFIGYLICNPSPQNMLIVTATMIALNMRAIFEERLLTQDPSYAEYVRRVPWRFLPHLY
jgi:protein-S-isoprenylcysteine O-methyltransferase Ste14/uncharacterized membrane protein (UPF0127 family)